MALPRRFGTHSIRLVSLGRALVERLVCGVVSSSAGRFCARIHDWRIVPSGARERMLSPKLIEPILIPPDSIILLAWAHASDGMLDMERQPPTETAASSSTCWSMALRLATEESGPCLSTSKLPTSSSFVVAIIPLPLPVPLFKLCSLLVSLRKIVHNTISCQSFFFCAVSQPIGHTCRAIIFYISPRGLFVR